MNSSAESQAKPRFLFFIAGASVALVCGVIQFRWMDIVPYAAYDAQPDWLKDLEVAVGWLPWIAVVVVLVLRLVKGRRFRAVSYFLGTATPAVALAGWLILSPSIEGYVHSQAFDAKLWRDQEQIEHDVMWPPRLCMVDDLLSGGELNGLAREQVVELLGTPVDEDFPLGAVDCDIHYYLGPERGLFRIDSEWLFISFSADGTVSRAWLYQD